MAAQAQPTSPGYVKEEKSYSTANTPNSAIPNYMAATESAEARIWSQSAPRQRPSMPERECGDGSVVNKHLSYPKPEPYCVNFGFGCNGLGPNLRSPSFKSVQSGYGGIEEQFEHGWRNLAVFNHPFGMHPRYFCISFLSCEVAADRIWNKFW